MKILNKLRKLEDDHEVQVHVMTLRVDPKTNAVIEEVAKCLNISKNRAIIRLVELASKDPEIQRKVDV